MGSERLEMGKRPPQEAENAAQTRVIAPSNTHVRDSVNTHALGWLNAPPNACCFCWCCCCSCSCLTVQASKDEKIQERMCEKQSEPEVEDLPGPTLDEARLWAQSFEHLIKSARGRDHFRQFLKTEFSEENLLFWLACEELKKETNRTVVEQTVKQIYEDYISILSPREVSLDSRVRDVINKNMLEPSSQTFDDAQQQIYTLMQRDSYPRYMNSSMYAELIKSLETPDLPNES
ncbi:regulator of G-protein signaling 20 [Electrophorus electricus]|uniref:RGS domain-containing protein n=1 Tax=Electrophorus electricus TaxID=8005 RepID=A0A4W4DTG0_ELEEL|nr:regulator of G-protein signaling 20 [Electrophorus electricus]XP_026868958.1 regulator of G-protein signaling 20 [Electrophorus electricus]